MNGFGIVPQCFLGVALWVGALARHDSLPRLNRRTTTSPTCRRLRNAKQSMVASGKNEKFLTVSVHEVDRERVRIKISDNGLGIPLENLTCIFQHGFTTKKDGHGFGLHCSANAAKEMGGTLAAHSEGADQGAFFTIDLPAVIRESAGSIAKLNEFISTSENSKI